MSNFLNNLPTSLSGLIVLRDNILSISRDILDGIKVVQNPDEMLRNLDAKMDVVLDAISAHNK